MHLLGNGLIVEEVADISLPVVDTVDQFTHVIELLELDLKLSALLLQLLVQLLLVHTVVVAGLAAVSVTVFRSLIRGLALILLPRFI